MKIRLFLGFSKHGRPSGDPEKVYRKISVVELLNGLILWKNFKSFISKRASIVLVGPSEAGSLSGDPGKVLPLGISFRTVEEFDSMENL